MMPKLTAERGRAAAYGVALALGLAVAAMGYITSFDNLADYADEHDWAWGPALPIGLDLGIPALLILDWLRASFFLRAAAWALALGTVAANGVVASGGWTDRLLHAVMPALAIVIIEAARHLRDDPQRMDRIRLSRWLLSPIRTARLWRRMVLWEVTSYSEALSRESAILQARTVLAAHYGCRSWRAARRRVPLTLRHQLATGQLPISVLHGLDVAESVQEWVELSLQAVANKRLPGAVDGSDLVATDASSERQEERQDRPELATVVVDWGPVSGAVPGDRFGGGAVAELSPAPAPETPTAPPTETAPEPRARRPRAGAKSRRQKSRQKSRRSKDEWVEVAGPVFHAEFARLRRQPTAYEFAKAIKAEGLGSPSESTAKAVRAEIIDRIPVPALDDESGGNHDG